jgi:hypothetical protein
MTPEQLRHISSEDRYPREITGRHITAKDYRTWAATNLAVLEIAALQKSMFWADAVVNTVAPLTLANWIAKWPTPPDPPWINTVWPASRCPVVKEPLPRRQSSCALS